ncbi:MAG: LysR family transcriptional regulator [Asticcacaulis sp.]|uniref:LysR family transcriptional regulator n=1 Tax=Asticcacaulis sp. TaxID=1872648 RepID=UPI0039E403C4
MSDLDLNLLVALDALLQTRSVTAAARRMRLSPSAMSRTLSRLRAVLDDPVLVPAGRVMVPTPHAERIAEQVSALNADIHAVLRPPPEVDIATLNRDFTIRANEAFVLRHAARLAASVAAAAPKVRLRFAPKPDKDIRLLREGTVDLDIGVIPGDGAELRAQTLYHDVFMGIVRAGHPLLDGPVTPERYVAWGHVVSSRRGRDTGPVDGALAKLGLSRQVNIVVPSFPAVVAVAAVSDLIGLAPRSFCQTGPDMKTVVFDLPVRSPAITVSQIWHPRMDADAGHRWLRSQVFEAFR